MILEPFLDLTEVDAREADVLLLPLPFEGTVSYGSGTSHGPAAIWQASTQIELWDEELDFDLDSLGWHTAEAVVPETDESSVEYLDRVGQRAETLQQQTGLVVAVGGEHSLTPPLVTAAAGGHQLSGLTVIQIDAHSDLRDSFEGTPHSHACAMRRLVDQGATLIAIGIRSAERDEFEYGRRSGRVSTYFAQDLADNTKRELELLETLSKLDGDIYLTIDVDGLELSLSPGTGTPQPGGLGWWQTLRYLRALLGDNRRLRLLGCDVVETVPQPHAQVNEMTAARLITKVVGYHSHSQS